MTTFIIGLVLLIVGGAVYGKFVEHIFHPDDRQTPAIRKQDGVDFVPMSKFKNALINLLNIAGTGPIFGPIQGILFGPIAFITIPIGCVISGAVHDYLSGMMSLRQDGAQMPGIVRKFLGNKTFQVYNIFLCILMLLVGAVFTYTPGDLFANQIVGIEGVNIWTWVIYAVILAYYLIATLFPIDKIIGKLYPVFGICLIIMALGIGGAIVLTRGSDMPELTAAAFTVVHPDSLPKWSMMFVTVACGAISGFHATQSPMMARCITSEKQGRTIFYGAMVAEGVIALIWAAAGVTFYTNHGSLLDGMTGLTNAIAAGGAGDVVYQISTTLLGPVGGVLAMIGVIACPITSGDTAYRSARLTIADWFHIDQAKVGPRAALSVPLLAVGAVIALALPWDVLWRYFS